MIELNSLRSYLICSFQQVQLEQFYVKIRDNLQTTRISHFEFVTPEDLEQVSLLFRLIDRAF